MLGIVRSANIIDMALLMRGKKKDKRLPYGRFPVNKQGARVIGFVGCCGPLTWIWPAADGDIDFHCLPSNVMAIRDEHCRSLASPS